MALAASAIIAHGDKLLFVRSQRTRDNWAFPGGSREDGEALEDTARRETKEEVGLDVEITGELGVYRIPYPNGGGFEITCYAAVSASEELALEDEILEAKWLTLDEGRQLKLTSTARDALEKYAATLER